MPVLHSGLVGADLHVPLGVSPDVLEVPNSTSNSYRIENDNGDRILNVNTVSNLITIGDSTNAYDVLFAGTAEVEQFAAKFSNANTIEPSGEAGFVKLYADGASPSSLELFYVQGDGTVVGPLGSGGGGGETNTASNLGAGEGVFAGKVGVDLEFKSLTGSGIGLTSTATEIDIGITINNLDGQGLYAGLTGGAHEFRGIQEGTLITATQNVGDVTIDVANEYGGVGGSSGVATTITGPGVWAVVSTMADTYPSNVLTDGGGSVIVVSEAGDYLLSYELVLSGTTNDQIEAQIEKNSGATTVGALDANVVANATDGCRLRGTIIATLAASDQIELWVRNTSGSNNVTVERSSFTAIRLA